MEELVLALKDIGEYFPPNIITIRTSEKLCFIRSNWARYNGIKKWYNDIRGLYAHI